MFLSKKVLAIVSSDIQISALHNEASILFSMVRNRVSSPEKPVSYPVRDTDPKIFEALMQGIIEISTKIDTDPEKVKNELNTLKNLYILLCQKHGFSNPKELYALALGSDWRNQISVKALDYLNELENFYDFESYKLVPGANLFSEPNKYNQDIVFTVSIDKPNTNPEYPLFHANKGLEILVAVGENYLIIPAVEKQNLKKEIESPLFLYNYEAINKEISEYTGIHEEDPLANIDFSGMKPDQIQKIQDIFKANRKLQTPEISTEFKKAFLESLSFTEVITKNSKEVLAKMLELHTLYEDELKNLTSYEFKTKIKEADNETRLKMILVLLLKNKTDQAYDYFKTIPDSEHKQILHTLSGRAFKELNSKLTLDSFKDEKIFKNYKERIAELKIEILNSRLNKESKIWANEQTNILEDMTRDKKMFSIEEKIEIEQLLKRLETIIAIPSGVTSNPIVTACDAIGIEQHLANMEKALDKITYGQPSIKKALMAKIGAVLASPNITSQPLLLIGPKGMGKTAMVSTAIQQGLGYHLAVIDIEKGEAIGDLFGTPIYRKNELNENGAPGLFTKGQIEARSETVVYLIKNLDKLAAPAFSFINEAINPDINTHFRDDFIPGIHLDLSKALFIFSAEDYQAIPKDLREKMSIVEADPQSAAEKVEIGLNINFPEALKNSGFTEGEVILNREDMEYIVANEYLEGGTRIQALMLKDLLEKVKNQADLYKKLPGYRIPRKLIDKVLKDWHKPRVIEKAPEVGVVTGLWVSSNGGGGINWTQCKCFKDDRGEFILTGSIGDSMKESLYVSRTIAGKLLGIEDIYNYSFHMHLPNTSEKKNGPSGGGKHTLAMISALTGIPIKNDVATTGEIDLNGKIKAIGGLFYKLHGAKRAGIKTVFISKENADDLAKIKEQDPMLLEKNKFEVVIIDNIMDLMRGCLVKMPEKLKPISSITEQALKSTVVLA